MWSRSINTRLPLTNLLTEILIRVVLLAVVCVMQLNVHGHMHYITEAELLGDYRRPRRDSIVAPWLLICLIIFIPLLFISLPLLITRNYMETTQAFLAWTLALSVNAAVTEILKMTVKRPRPDFFYRCFPDGKVTKELRCTGNLRDVIEGRKSFPSGHSSFSFSSLGFLSLWACGKLGVLSRNRGNGLRTVVCLLPILSACAVASSRYCDNHHHWEDIFVGSLLGFFTAYVSYRQYYYPLNSQLSGTSSIIDESGIIDNVFNTECCSRDLNNPFYQILRLADKNIAE